MSPDSKKPAVGVTIQSRARSDSIDSASAPSVRTPRTARFAEATAVHSPIEPSEASKSPFARLGLSDKSKTQHAAAQPSDVGFGYISQNDGVGQVRSTLTVDDARYLPPSTPKSPLKSPLKSALKSPGAPPRVIENPLSPTFKEEQELEVQEKTTEKKQAKDLVSSRTPVEIFLRLLTSLAEIQNPCANGQGLSTRHQLQLQSHRARNGSIYLCHLQCDQSHSSAQQPSTMGQGYTRMAPDYHPRHCQHLSPHGYRCLLCLVAWRSSAGREGGCLLHHVCRCLLHL